MEESLNQILGSTGVLPLLALFLVSLLAATILPLGSELWLIFLQNSQNYHPLLLLVFASTGNILGSVITYKMGEWGKKKLDTKDLERSSKIIKKYGALAGLLAWVPLIGDPLALALGYFRTDQAITFVCFSLGKIMRYIVVMGVFSL
ncbi:MAG: DedA family protein [Bdellovibrionota bacterium]|nr:DedA family protein [Bdellovibrionota bacterium]